MNSNKQATTQVIKIKLHVPSVIVVRVITCIFVMMNASVDSLHIYNM